MPSLWSMELMSFLLSLVRSSFIVLSCSYNHLFDLFLVLPDTGSKLLLCWWYTIKKLAQESCMCQFAQETFPSVVLSCTSSLCARFLHGMEHSHIDARDQRWDVWLVVFVIIVCCTKFDRRNSRSCQTSAPTVWNHLPSELNDSDISR